MKRYTSVLLLTALIVATLACKALPLSVAEDEPTSPSPVNDTSTQPSDVTVEEEIPIPEEAVNLQTFDNTTIFQVAMTIEEGANYYLTEMAARGYMEETAITVISEDIFSLVFSGHSSGMEVSITGTNNGDGTITIAIELADVLSTPSDTNVQPSAQPNSNNPAGVADEEIPIPENAVDIIKVADTLMFQVEMTIEEGANYYLTEMPARGYTEVSSITRISNDSFTLVFSGHPSGLEVYIVGTDDGSGKINIAIELRDIIK